MVICVVNCRIKSKGVCDILAVPHDVAVFFHIFYKKQSCSEEAKKFPILTERVA